MVEPLRHRQTKGAANRYARPKATAPHSYSTDFATKYPSGRILDGVDGAPNGIKRAKMVVV